jgi:hypothetical protein
MMHYFLLTSIVVAIAVSLLSFFPLVSILYDPAASALSSRLLKITTKTVPTT